MTAENRTELTYRYERWRAISAGVLETAGTTFLLLIAVRGYQAGAWAKALVAGGGLESAQRIEIGRRRHGKKFFVARQIHMRCEGMPQNQKFIPGKRDSPEDTRV